MAQGRRADQAHPPEPAARTSLIAPRLLRRREAAAYLAISEPTLDAYGNAGFIKSVQLPAVRGDGASRIPYFDRHDLNEFVQRLKDGGTQ